MNTKYQTKWKYGKKSIELEGLNLQEALILE